MSGFSKLIGVSSSLLFGTASKKLSVSVVQARASHGRTMFIRPGKFYSKKYFDIVVSFSRSVFSCLFVYELFYMRFDLMKAFSRRSRRSTVCSFHCLSEFLRR